MAGYQTRRQEKPPNKTRGKKINYEFDPVSPHILLINPLNAELNLICHLLALGAHHILHVSRIRVKSHLSSAGIIRSAPYSPH
jgi:hypothetical protein